MDLLFNTGSTSIFENHMTFAMNAMANAALEGSPQNLEAYKRWLYVRPANYYNLIDMMVKGPSSYTKLHYYTKFPVLLTDCDGVEYYCKFRLVPFDKDAEIEGLLNEEEQKKMMAYYYRKQEDMKVSFCFSSFDYFSCSSRF